MRRLKSRSPEKFTGANDVKVSDEDGFLYRCMKWRIFGLSGRQRVCGSVFEILCLAFRCTLRVSLHASPQLQIEHFVEIAEIQIVLGLSLANLRFLCDGIRGRCVFCGGSPTHGCHAKGWRLHTPLCHAWSWRQKRLAWRAEGGRRLTLTPGSLVFLSPHVYANIWFEQMWKCCRDNDKFVRHRTIQLEGCAQHKACELRTHLEYS